MTDEAGLVGRAYRALHGETPGEELGADEVANLLEEAIAHVKSQAARITALEGERNEGRRQKSQLTALAIIMDAEAALSRPIPMVLYCPACGLQHIDAETAEWENPPHRSHLCLGCGHIWRPADVATNGVAAIATAGKADSPTRQAGQVASDDAVDYVARYGSFCRGCADNDGVCPSDGLPCEGRAKAIRHVLDALIYGITRGFLKVPGLIAGQRVTLDREVENE